MKPGRELDALVAEKVMGLKKAYLGDGTAEFPLLETWDGKLLSAYSTDISAAWELVTKLEHLNPTIHYEDTCGQWSCTFNSGLSGDEWMAFSDIDGGSSAPHAICLAALRACGIEVK